MFQRMTERLKNGQITLAYGDITDSALWQRLAEYEDTGLPPDEISLRLRELDQLKTRIAKINDLSRKARYAITELAAEAEVHI